MQVGGKTNIDFFDLPGSPFIDNHCHGAENRGNEAHDQLHLHDKGVSHSLLGSGVGELHQGEDEGVERRSSKRHQESQVILKLAHPLGPVAGGMHPQHQTSEAQQRHGIDRIRRELLPNDDEGEQRRESQLCGRQDG